MGGGGLNGYDDWGEGGEKEEKRTKWKAGEGKEEGYRKEGEVSRAERKGRWEGLDGYEKGGVRRVIYKAGD